MLSNIRLLIQKRQYSQALDEIESKFVALDAAENAPHQFLELVEYKCYCLLRTNNFKGIIETLQSIGGLDSPYWTKEYHPEIYGDEKGPLVPIRLELCVAIIPYLCNNPFGSLDALSALQKNYENHLISIEKGKGKCSEYDICKENLYCIIHTLSIVMVSIDHYQDAIELLEKSIIEKDSAHCPTLALLGFICLKIGALEDAENYFDSAKAESYNDIISNEHNAGLLNLCKGNMDQAVECFSKSLSAINSKENNSNNLFCAPSKANITNNTAAALFYSKKLFDATLLLERLMDDDDKSVCPSSVRNLLTLYEFSPSKDICVSYIRGVAASAAKQDPEVLMVLKSYATV